MVSRAATLLVLSFGVTTSGAWGTTQANRCTDECLANIDPGAGAETCYSVTQGKPVKACLSSFRDAIKKSCNKVCSGADMSQLINEANIYCDYARHELPRPTVHRACIMGYSSAFDRVSAFFKANPSVLQGGVATKAEPVPAAQSASEEELFTDEHMELMSDEEEEEKHHEEEHEMEHEDEHEHDESEEEDDHMESEEEEEEHDHEDEEDEHDHDEHDEEPHMDEDSEGELSDGDMFSDEETAEAA